MNKRVGLVVLAGLLVLGGCKSAEVSKTSAAEQGKTTEMQSVYTGRVASPQEVSELRNKIVNAEDGAVIEIEAGKYDDLGRMTLSANNVEIKAVEAGEVIFGGNVQIIVTGENNLIDSLVFRDGGAVIDRLEGSDRDDITGVIGLYGTNNTFNNSVIYQFNDYEYEPDAKGKYPNIRWVTIGGVENKVTNNTFEGKHKRGAILVVQTSDKLEKALVEGNVFKDIRPLDIELIEASNPAMARTNKNDRQAIRLGDSKNSQFDSESIIRDNYFEQIDGELELMSIKACNVLIEGNTVRNSMSMISLRHGSNITAKDNVIFGDGKAGTGGIRFYDMNHVIENNYVEGTLGTGNMRGGISINTGLNDVANGEELDQNVKGKEYSKQWTPKNVTIKNNTLVNNAQGILVSDKSHRVSLTDNTKVEAVFAAVDTHFENNLVIADTPRTLTVYGAPSEKFELVNPTFENNIIAGPKEGIFSYTEGVVETMPTIERENGLVVAVDGIGATNLEVLSEENTGSTIKVK